MLPHSLIFVKHLLIVGKLENVQKTYPYRFMEVQLEHVFEKKDMGIIIDTDLTFDVHVSEKIKKTNNMLGTIRIFFCCLIADILLPLYKAFVRHLLEYMEHQYMEWTPEEITNQED